MTAPARRQQETEDLAAYRRLAAHAARGRARPAALRAYAASPATSMRAVRYVLSLPRLTLRPTASPAGDRVRAGIARTAGRSGWGLRLAQPVLAIPPTEAAYVTGNRRQTVRKNARKAARDGYCCRTVPVDEALTVHGLTVPDGRLVAVAESADGTPRAITLATVDGEWALLEGMLKLGDDTPSSARYLLQLYRLAGAHHLLAPLPHPDRPGLRYFQHILGFVPTNVILGPPT